MDYKPKIIINYKVYLFYFMRVLYLSNMYIQKCNIKILIRVK